MSIQSSEINSWFDAYKPRSSVLTNLFLAGLMWSAVGIFLLLRGELNLNRTDCLVYLIFWVMIGVLKGRLILDKTAARIRDRILERGDGKCAGGFLAFKSWGLILVMILFGRLLRMSSLPSNFVWGVYAAIGTGLLFSSRIFWIRWFKKSRNDVAQKT
ncbi:MAG: hypothetical protein ACUVQ6_01175 [Dissulfurimicrobium sp.]|uniref:hypothetical protein n=1 Tax=Dissulfurimicrobium sp. TaxID=2022436 RepID=UPI0040498B9A